MQANYNPKIIAGATFPTIELPTYNGGVALLGKPENGHDWKMVVVYRGQLTHVQRKKQIIHLQSPACLLSIQKGRFRL